MKIYIASITTDSLDHYVMAFNYKPTRKEIIKQIWEDEGKCADLKFYEDTTGVYVEKVLVKEKK